MFYKALQSPASSLSHGTAALEKRSEAAFLHPSVSPGLNLIRREEPILDDLQAC